MMRKHILTGFMLLALLGFLMGGAAAAYFTDEAPLGSSTEFQLGTVDIEVVKETDNGDAIEITSGETSGNVTWSITNTGNTGVWLRAKIIEEYLEATDDDPPDGYNPTAPNIDPVSVDDDWEEGNDRFYYYSDPVPSNETVYFDLTFRVDGSWWGECEIKLEAEAVQASNNARSAKEAIWPEI